MNLLKLRYNLRPIPTQTQVAEALGMKQQQYQMWESGLIRPEYRNLLKLAQFFKVTIEELFEPDEIDEMKNH